MRTHRLAAVVGAAVLGLAGCTSSGGHRTPRAAVPVSSSARALRVPVGCADQYRGWMRGEGKGVMTALDTVAAAARGADGRTVQRALRHVRPTVVRAAAHPIPACADPRGYWAALLMHVNAAVSGQATGAGLRAALRDVPEIHRQLVIEVKHVA